MVSREVAYELVSIARAFSRVVSGAVNITSNEVSTFYKTSTLTKSCRIHDEMWDELHEKSHEIRIQSPIITPTKTKKAKKPTVTSKRHYSTRRVIDIKPVNKDKTKVDESRYAEIPSTKLQRLFHYGHLATSVGLNVANDGLKSIAKGERPNLRKMALSSKNVSVLSNKLRKMRGAALKIGQLLSIQDESFLPKELSNLLKSVQNQGYFMPPRQLNRILVSNFGENWRDNFKEFDEVPIASASISQVHKAVLQTGETVAVKVQYPGVKDSIDSDMDTLLMLLTSSNLLPKGMFAENSIGNARLELKWECDFNREASNIKKFHEFLLNDDVFQVPKVYDHLTNENILTMDFLDGEELIQLETDQALNDWLATNIMRLCLQEISQFKFMQTDPNWANFLYNPQTKKIQLLDFGASRAFDDEFIFNYVSCLRFAVEKNLVKVEEFSEKLGYLTGLESKEMIDAHVESVVTLGEPFSSKLYDFATQDVTTRVKSKMGLMLKERLTPPPEETYSLHRKFSGVFLLCTRLKAKVPCKELFDKYFTV